MSNFSAGIQALLDTSLIPSQIKEIEKNKINLYNLQFDKSKLISDIQSALNNHKFTLNFSNINMPNIANQMKQSGTSAGNNFVNAFNKSASDINTTTRNSENTIKHMQKTLASLKFDSSAINTITKDLNEMNISVGNVGTRIKGDALNITVKGVDELGRAVTVVKQFEFATGNISTVSKSFNQSFKGMTENTENFASTLQVSTLKNKMNSWLDKNTRAAKDFGVGIQSLNNRLETLSSTGKLTETELKNIEREFKEIQQAAIAAGKTGKSFGITFKAALQSITKYVGASEIIRRTIDTLRQMYQAVYDIDTAMTNLRKVTDETSERYDTFLKSSSQSAKELGRSVSSLVEQSANWAKLGYSLDDAEKLAELSSIYANVAEIDNATAVSDMVTAMKAFNIEAEKAQSIIDPLNELGNTFATSASALGEGLSKSASALDAAGTDMYKTLAMLTGGAEITQNAGEFGNFLKVASMRIRGMKGQLEELGEEVDDSIDSISKVQTQILNLTEGKVNIFDDSDEFRDFYDIMNDISEIVDGMSSTDKASLYEILFGKMRGNQGAALIKAFQSGQIEKAYKTALDSDGSAIEEQARWMESLGAKTEQFQAAFQELSQELLDSDGLKFLVDTGTTILETITKIINGVEELPGVANAAIPILATLVSTIASLNNVGELINQFQFLIVLRVEYAHKVSNGNMNDTMLMLVA